MSICPEWILVMRPYWIFRLNELLCFFRYNWPVWAGSHGWIRATTIWPLGTASCSGAPRPFICLNGSPAVSPPAVGGLPCSFLSFFEPLPMVGEAGCRLLGRGPPSPQIWTARCRHSWPAVTAAREIVLDLTFLWLNPISHKNDRFFPHLFGHWQLPDLRKKKESDNITTKLWRG